MPPKEQTDVILESGNNEAVVIVTPYSTGCCVAVEIARRGYQLICVWSKGFSEEMKLHVPVSCGGLEYFAEVTEGDNLDKTIDQIQQAANNMEIVAVVCGGEAGVDLADALSEQMGLLTNGTDIPNRRDKKVQQEIIKEAGLRSIRQAGGSKFSEVEDFLMQETYPVIVKPVDSAGSDGVKLCHTFEEAKEHFLYLMNDHDMVNGGDCGEVLCQEYLQGKEYVVDHVSRDGVHKTMFVWLYDKRPANGGSFVYFGELAVDSESEEAKLLVPYARDVLNALGIKNGPSHGEFIITPTGPCLVEMNSRCNGGDGSWCPLVNAMTGTDQVVATVDCFVQPSSFLGLPDMPPSPFLAFGQLVEFVSYSEGLVKATPGFEKIKQLPSFVSLESNVKKGTKISKTFDLVTCPGAVVLMHDDKDVVEKDVQFIRYLEKSNAMFEYEAEQIRFPAKPGLDRKLSLPKEPAPVSLLDHFPASPYLERKLSRPKSPVEMYYENCS